MSILDKFKEAFNLQDLDEETAHKIIEQLDSEIEELKEAQKEEEKDKAREDTLAWANKVIEARGTIRKRNDARKKLRFESTISPARRVRLRKLGKLK